MMRIQLTTQTALTSIIVATICGMAFIFLIQ